MSGEADCSVRADPDERSELIGRIWISSKRKFEKVGKRIAVWIQIFDTNTIV
jgi:hypothetical protein